MLRPILSLLCTCLFYTALQAQVTVAPSVISTGGGYGNNGDLTISWTIGELAVTTLKGNNMLLTQGFQQPFDVGVGIQGEKVDWNIAVYPNPVEDELTIRFNIQHPGDYLVEIQDVTGRLISQGQYRQIRPGGVIVLNTSAYTYGIYFLKVSTSDRRQSQVTSLRKL